MHFVSKSGARRHLLTCTRIHRKNAKSDNLDHSTLPADIMALGKFIVRAKKFSDAIAVAYDASDALLAQQVVDVVARLSDKVPVVAVPVMIWGSFIPALNALVYHAAAVQATNILFLSVEVALSRHSVDTLHRYMDEETLVVGAALDGHEFSEGEQELSGVTTPWNTAAVWNVPSLMKTGFLGIAEGYTTADGKVMPAGVEEVSVIALHQKLFPGKAKAKVIDISGASWQARWMDEEREKWHRAKMASKVSRPAAHLAALGNLSGTVEHIHHYRKESLGG
eukprot:Colp12_sorted_trinity150504_noHs@22396